MSENDPETLPLGARKMIQWNSEGNSMPWCSGSLTCVYQAMDAKTWSTIIWVLSDCLMVPSEWKKMGGLWGTTSRLSLAFPPFPLGGQIEIVSHCPQGSEEVSPLHSENSCRLKIDSQQIFLQLALQPFGAFCFKCHPFWYVGYGYKDFVPLIISSFTGYIK